MDTYTELERLFPFLARYRKLFLAWLTATIPFVLFLVSGPQPAYAIVLAGFAYVLGLFGVYQVPNAFTPRR